MKRFFYTLYYIMSLVSQLSRDNTHVYYNITITNNDVSGTRPAPQVVFNEIRNTPILSRPEDYFLSIVRFNLETPSLPLFIPQVQIGQTDVNLLVYSITLTYKTYEYQHFVEYQSANLFASPPSAPIAFQDIESKYYYVYSYQWWNDLMNTAFQAAFDGLKALVIAGGDTLPTNNAPFMEWNPTNSTAILNADVLGYNSKSGSDYIKIYFNNPLFTLYSSFEATLNVSSSVTNGKNAQFVMFNNQGLNIFNVSSGYNVIQAYQEYSTAPLMNPIQALVFTTALVPINPELTSVPTVYGADSNFFNVGNNANITLTLTDFVVGLTEGFEYKPSVTYVPPGEYRLVDMQGNSPISSVNVSVFWRDRFGGLNPFNLNSGCTATIKIMFRKRDFNVSM